MDEKLQERIIAHEGISHYAYTDTIGFITVGIGRCLDPRRGQGLSTDECLYLLGNDIKRITAELSKYHWFTIQDPVRQGVLIELAFNMGIAGLCTFTQMITDLEAKNYGMAYIELMASRWVHQVGKERSQDIGYRLKTGQYQ